MTNLFKKNIITLLISFLISGMALSAQTANSVQNTEDPDAFLKKVQAERLKFQDETFKLRSAHNEKMRALQLKNTNTLFDQLAKDLKEIDKIERESVLDEKLGTESYKQSMENQKKTAMLSEEFATMLQKENDKFYEEMKKRQDSFNKKISDQFFENRTYNRQQIRRPASVRTNAPTTTR